MLSHIANDRGYRGYFNTDALDTRDGTGNAVMNPLHSVAVTSKCVLWLTVKTQMK